MINGSRAAGAVAIVLAVGLAACSGQQQGLSLWLGPAIEGAQVVPNFDEVEALAEDRAALWARVGGAEFLSNAEKREMVGFAGRSRSE